MAIAAIITKHQLMAQKHDIEYKILTINQAKLSLAGSMSDLMTVGTDLDPDNPVVKQLEQRKARLNMLEKKLDMQLLEYENKLKLIEKNLGEAEKMIK